jgi:ascorbate-specific PTS system EIIC-type component UlaA
MFKGLLLSACVMSLCVAVHAIGTTAAIRRVDRSRALADPGYWPQTWLLIRVANFLILMHLADITIWGLLYIAGDAMPGAQAAFYFSSVTYTTVGYGDLVLPERWRLVGGIEALTGILMCGWSAAFFFDVVGRMHRSRQATASETRSAAG